jgi:two-component system response regulator TctD
MASVSPVPLSVRRPPASREETCILLVEDDEECRRSVLRALRRRGYVVCGAGSARAALAVYSALQPTLVITDLFMPGGDGIQLIGELKLLDPGVALAVVTGLLPGDPRVGAALNAGARTVLFKPFTPEELDHALGLALPED